ncbi:MAG TPA: AmmeMemoRadiSam system protein B, partial [Haliangiales bacterium]|nr:AmmeMemoRadiSam system protein B [Haliangiales bacterium]
PAPAPRLGLVAPHAGYMYSGGVAGKTFRLARIPPLVVILAPNHTGRGARVSVLAARALRIPGRDVPVSSELSQRILREVPGATLDVRAHEREHAAEVEVPFLVALRPDVEILPIVLGGLGGDETVAVGRGLARALAGLDVLVVASSDMSHYLPDAMARARDKLALEPLLALDPEGLYRTVEDNDISMCGILPATAMLAYARENGAARAELAAYATSGDASGDYSAVVGYAGVLVS